MIDFFVRCVPPKTSHHRKKITKIGRFYRIGDTQKLTDARGTLESLFQPFAPETPIAGAVSLRVEYEWPWREKDKKRTRALGRIPSVVRPDCSNLVKTTEDILVLLRFIEDDNAVAELLVRKWIGDTPGIRVSITSFVDEKENGCASPAPVSLSPQPPTAASEPGSTSSSTTASLFTD